MMDRAKTSSGYEKLLLLVALLSTVLFYFTFYPPTFAIRDESAYYAMSQALLKGTISLENANLPVHSDTTVAFGEKLYGKYPLGMPLLLTPFVWLSFKSIFLFGLMSHLLNTFLFHRLKNIFQVRGVLATILFLLYPPFILYSRTLMSDIPATTLFLLAACLYFSNTKNPEQVGLLAGLQLLIRPANAVLILPFAAGYFHRMILERKPGSLLRFCLGLAPAVLVAGFLNKICFGAFFTNGYSASGEKLFSPAFLPGNLTHYLISLNLMYPGMLLLFFFSRKLWRGEILISVVSVLTLYLFYFFHDSFSSPAATCLLGLRFLFPLMVFFILVYGEFLDGLFKEQKTKNIFLLCVLSSLLAVSFFIHGKHHIFLNRQSRLTDLVYQKTPDRSVIAYDVVAAELLRSRNDGHLYIPFRDAGTLALTLRQRGLRESVFLIKRDVLYADRHLLEGVSADEMRQLKSLFYLTPVFRENNFEIIELRLKENQKPFNHSQPSSVEPVKP